jgi:hypothetical protein
LESSSVQSTAAVFLCARAFFKILLAKFYKVAKMRNSKFKKSKIKWFWFWSIPMARNLFIFKSTYFYIWFSLCV